MELKPIDLLNKSFDRKVRGYDAAQVDGYLKDAARGFEEALSENARLRERVTNLENELQRYKDIEATLNNALVLAQKTADEVKANAQKEADLIARESRDELNRELEAARRNLGDIRQSRDRFAAEFRSLLRSYVEMCEGGNFGGKSDASSGE